MNIRFQLVPPSVNILIIDMLFLYFKYSSNNRIICGTNPSKNPIKNPLIRVFLDVPVHRLDLLFFPETFENIGIFINNLLHLVF